MPPPPAVPTPMRMEKRKRSYIANPAAVKLKWLTFMPCGPKSDSEQELVMAFSRNGNGMPGIHARGWTCLRTYTEPRVTVWLQDCHSKYVSVATCPIAGTTTCRSAILGSRIVEVESYCSCVSLVLVVITS